MKKKIIKLTTSPNGTKSQANMIDKVMKELEFDRQTQKMSNKELGDYLIENFWAKEEWGTKRCSVIDRVIQILLDEPEDNLNKKIDCKCKAS